jgi:glycosyltransferase involved in cell wall biosynthesis
LECPALRYTAERWSLSDTVRFVGFTDDIRSVWKTHQALLLPSFHEGMPIVIHEAMLLNRVCVVTEVGGASEVIADGASGFLAPSASYDHFAQAMERWWHQRGRWRAIAEAAGLAVRQWRGQHPLDRLVAALSG